MDRSQKDFQIFNSNFFPKNRRGISEIILTVTLILVGIAAVGIASVSFGNLLEKKSEQIGIESLMMDFDVKSVKVLENGDVSVSVRRNPGSGDLSGINFIFSDGNERKVLEKSTGMKELEQQTFIFSQNELSGISSVKDVSVAPVVKSGSGKDVVKNIVETQKVTALATDENRELIVVD